MNSTKGPSLAGREWLAGTFSVADRSHLEVGGSHPGFYRTEGVLHGPAAFAHLIRVSIEARLHRLVLPA
jgi:hypothetical protein